MLLVDFINFAWFSLRRSLKICNECIVGKKNMCYLKVAPYKCNMWRIKQIFFYSQKYKLTFSTASIYRICISVKELIRLFSPTRTWKSRFCFCLFWKRTFSLDTKWTPQSKYNVNKLAVQSLLGYLTKSVMCEKSSVMTCVLLFFVELSMYESMKGFLYDLIFFRFVYWRHTSN